MLTIRDLNQKIKFNDTSNRLTEVEEETCTASKNDNTGELSDHYGASSIVANRVVVNKTMPKMEFTKISKLLYHNQKYQKMKDGLKQKQPNNLNEKIMEYFYVNRIKCFKYNYNLDTAVSELSSY